MKKPLLIVLSILLLGGAYMGYKEIRRMRLLSSGRDVLLVNKKAGTYSFTSLMESDDITRAYKAIGYTEELSEEKIQKRIGGLTLIGTKFDPIPPESIAVVPNAFQQDAWSNALQVLTSEQRELCDQLGRSEDVQSCLFRHYISQLLATQNVEGCKAIFVEAFVQECENVVSQNLQNAVYDADNDHLIDQYEFKADPESFEADPLG